MVNKRVDVSYFFLKTREVLKVDKDSIGSGCLPAMKCLASAALYATDSTVPAAELTRPADTFKFFTSLTSQPMARQ